MTDPAAPQSVDPAASQWFALKTRREFQAIADLAPHCDDTFLPTITIPPSADGRPQRQRPAIPRVIFVQAPASRLIDLEARARRHPELHVPFWIYRYPASPLPQPIPPSSLHLFRLLTSPDPALRCEIFTRRDFREGQRVRVIAGPFAGTVGTVQRVRRNRHLVVRIEALCLIMLPFIHPDLIAPID